MTLTGEMLIGTDDVRGTRAAVHAINPATNEALEPAYPGGTEEHVERACALAEQAFVPLRRLSPQQRAVFLETVASEIEALGDALLTRAHLETGLPLVRLQGERGRTCGQLRMFAAELRAGHWLDVRVDHALPQRQPLPRSDLRLQYLPLGPVAVFGASNFPLAFSVAGGDTAAALAAGCPVIVKGHSAHPGTSEMVGRAVRRAVQACGLPPGVFSLLFGSGSEVGQALARHPAIKAVAFTGSRAGGTALMRTAAERPEPIPVYAEMSSINPVFLLPGALAQRPDDIAKGFVQSLTLGSGQFCTNPGLVIAVRSPGLDVFIAQAKALVESAPATTMLTPGIHAAYESGVAQLAACEQVTTLARGQESAGSANACRAALFLTDAASFMRDAHRLGMEVFGASSMVIVCDDAQQMIALIAHLEGQLTATLHLEQDSDHVLAAQLIERLETRVGRIVVNGFPTGVEVANAMVHGGPFPATSDGRSTSVGTAAIYRFLRPVCYQDVPEQLLPPAVQESNPWGVPRRES